MPPPPLRTCVVNEILLREYPRRLGALPPLPVDPWQLAQFALNESLSPAAEVPELSPELLSVPHAAGIMPATTSATENTARRKLFFFPIILFLHQGFDVAAKGKSCLVNQYFHLSGGFLRSRVDLPGNAGDGRRDVLGEGFKSCALRRVQFADHQMVLVGEFQHRVVLRGEALLQPGILLPQFRERCLNAPQRGLQGPVQPAFDGVDAVGDFAQQKSLRLAEFRRDRLELVPEIHRVLRDGRRDLVDELPGLGLKSRQDVIEDLRRFHVRHGGAREVLVGGDVLRAEERADVSVDALFPDAKFPPRNLRQA